MNTTTETIHNAFAYGWCLAEFGDTAIVGMRLVVRQFGSLGALHQLTTRGESFRNIEPYQQAMIFMALRHIAREQAGRN